MLLQETVDGKDNQYQLHADLIPVDHPPHHYNLIFYSYYSASRDPNARQIRAQFVLTREGLEQFKTLLRIGPPLETNSAVGVRSSKLKTLLETLKS